MSLPNARMAIIENVERSKGYKEAEIDNGLMKIQKMENDLISLAQTRYKKLFVSGSCQEIDTHIHKLNNEMRDATRANLELQRV